MGHDSMSVPGPLSMTTSWGVGVGGWKKQVNNGAKYMRGKPGGRRLCSPDLFSPSL